MINFPKYATIEGVLLKQKKDNIYIHNNQMLFEFDDDGICISRQFHYIGKKLVEISEEEYNSILDEIIKNRVTKETLISWLNELPDNTVIKLVDEKESWHNRGVFSKFKLVYFDKGVEGVRQPQAMILYNMCEYTPADSESPSTT